MCRMPKQLRSCVNQKEPQTEAETDLKQIIIRPRQLFIITFFSLLSSSSVFGDLDNLLLWLVCWLRCSLRFIFRRLHLSLSLRPQHAITCRKRNQCHRPHSFSILQKKSVAPILCNRVHIFANSVRAYVPVCTRFLLQFFSACRSSFHVSKIA